jgi:hypothetical protein
VLGELGAGPAASAVRGDHEIGIPHVVEIALHPEIQLDAGPERLVEKNGEQSGPRDRDAAAIALRPDRDSVDQHLLRRHGHRGMDDAVECRPFRIGHRTQRAGGERHPETEGVVGHRPLAHADAGVRHPLLDEPRGEQARRAPANNLHTSQVHDRKLGFL